MPASIPAIPAKIMQIYQGIPLRPHTTPTKAPNVSCPVTPMLNKPNLKQNAIATPANMVGTELYKTYAIWLLFEKPELSKAPKPFKAAPGSRATIKIKPNRIPIKIQIKLEKKFIVPVFPKNSIIDWDSFGIFLSFSTNFIN